MHAQSSAVPQKAFLTTSVFVSAISIAVGMLGMFNQMVLANRFGTGREMDVYFGAITVPTIIAGIAPVVVGIVVLPLLVQSQASRYFTLAPTLFCFVVLTALSVTIVGVLSASAVIRILMPGLSPAHYSDGIHIAMLAWLSAGISLSSSFLIALHHSQGRFFRVACVSLLPSLFTIAAVVTLSRQYGVRCVAWGMLGACVLQFAVLLQGLGPSVFACKKISFRRSELPRCGARILPAVVSLLPFTASSTIMAFWAARTSEGAIATFGYAHSFATLLSVAVGYGVAVVSFPQMTRQYMDEEPYSFLDRAAARLTNMTVVAAFCLVTLGVMRKPLLELLFQHGAFRHSSVDATASVLPWFLVAGGCVACLNFLRNLFYVTGRYMRAAVLGFVVLVQLWATAGVLSHFFSTAGIAAAFTGSSAAYFALSLYFLRVPGRPHGLWSRAFTIHLARLAMAFALAWTAGAILVGHLRSIFGPLATLALGGPLACSICLGAAMLLVPACRLAPVLARFKDIVGQHPMRAGMPALPTAPE